MDRLYQSYSLFRCSIFDQYLALVFKSTKPKEFYNISMAYQRHLLFLLSVDFVFYTVSELSELQVSKLGPSSEKLRTFVMVRNPKPSGPPKCIRHMRVLLKMVIARIQCLNITITETKEKKGKC